MSSPPLFSTRYGLSPYPGNPHGHMAHRHEAAHRQAGSDRGGCEPDVRLRCRCNGSFYRGAPPQCCQRATREDMRCDDCREHCVGLSGDVLVLFPLVSVGGDAR